MMKEAKIAARKYGVSELDAFTADAYLTQIHEAVHTKSLLGLSW